MMNILKFLFLTASLFILISAGFQKDTPVLKTSFEHNSMPDSTIKIDAATGLKVDKGLELVIAHCTGCHSSKLITQFHTDRNGWLEKIRWMQQKQKLWDLGEAEPVILDYLAKNYPALEEKTRRDNLKNIQWYKLNKLKK